MLKIFLNRRETQRKFNAENAESSAPFAKRFAFFAVNLSSHLSCNTYLVLSPRLIKKPRQMPGPFKKTIGKNYKSVIGAYFGTSDLIMIQPIRYATAHIEKMIKYPDSIPSKPINFILVFLA